MASKKKMPSKPHGWEGIGQGKPPFEGAGHPIHVVSGGKYYRGDKKPHPDMKKYDPDGDCD